MKAAEEAFGDELTARSERVGRRVFEKVAGKNGELNKKEFKKWLRRVNNRMNKSKKLAQVKDESPAPTP